MKSSLTVHKEIDGSIAFSGRLSIDDVFRPRVWADRQSTLSRGARARVMGRRTIEGARMKRAKRREPSPCVRGIKRRMRGLLWVDGKCVGRVGTVAIGGVRFRATNV